ncbi:MAG: PAS domain S-box protein [Planctomycetia bacterium]|nr:PAS domain S-box protein [Planctomycetia bacterium]
MTNDNQESLEQRVVVLAPTSKDGALTASILHHAGLACVSCITLEQVCEQLDVGAAAVLLAEELVIQDRNDCLAEWLGRQPQWSDLPVLVIARTGADSAAVAQAMDLLGNVTVLERPTRVAALVSAIRTALRARQRQYQIRDHMAQRERDLETQARLGAIVASSDDAIISKTLEGKIQTWNAGAERIFGYSAAEAIGQSITLLIPPERHDEEAALLDRLRRGEHIEHLETVRVAKNGRRLDISLTVSPIRNVHGKIIGASKVARDITDRKQAEAALREADRRKDEFLATLAHELRNPLAPIRNSLHILRMTARNDPTAERVCEMMERQVNHMVRLVDDLMEVSRITRGLIDLRKEETDLATILRSAVETSKPLITAADHQLAITIPQEPIPLYGDAVRLSQIFANLLNNAAKYTDRRGQIWLSARPEGGEIIVSVRDNGIGMTASMLPKVFEMFMQADRSANRSQGGLGIGLTLVKRLTEMHGGSVSVHSEGPGHGTEFIVRLPVAATQTHHRQPSVNQKSTTLSQRRLLVVDDNEDSAASLGMLLKFLGTDVQVVHDGATALTMIESYRPDVVLLDIGMPGMDGFEVARRVRQRVDFHNIMLIALTGWGQTVDRERTRTAGFDHHLVKPADITALQSLLTTMGE